MQKRGRPPKYGQPARVVAVTLPVGVIDALRAVDGDLGWAIVSLVEHTRRRVAPGARPAAQLVEIGSRQALIAVDPRVFRPLPGVQVVPLSKTQAFLALQPGRGMADLELAVGDRLARLPARAPARRPLLRLLRQLRQWRRGRDLTFETRSIIIVRGRRRAATSRSNFL